MNSETRITIVICTLAICFTALAGNGCNNDLRKDVERFKANRCNTIDQTSRMSIEGLCK